MPSDIARSERARKAEFKAESEPAPPQVPNFVQLFVSVHDVKAAITNAETLGAKLSIPATILPEGDEMAVLLDPEGMSFAIWRGRQN